MANISCNYASLLQFQFDFLYCQEIIRKMHAVFKKHCWGCENFSLSQREHTCLTTSLKRQLEVHFEEIVCEIKMNDVLDVWEKATSVMNVPMELFLMFKQKLNGEEWGEATVCSINPRTP